MRNIALKIRYVGSAYHGWQKQKNAITVQEVIEGALTKLLKSETKVTGCGRTDAGVHAEKYCLNFKSDPSVPLEKLPHALNTLLPYDIAVLQACEAEDDFHAIRSCERKEYTYRICNEPIRNPFYEKRMYLYPDALDIGRMLLAAERFVGTHDFAGLQSVGTEVNTTVRTVYYFDITKSNTLIELKISANGFLYNMARAMTGTVLYAAIGKLNVDDISTILETGDRKIAGPTVPPHGLYMTGVWYKGVVGDMMQYEEYRV